MPRPGDGSAADAAQIAGGEISTRGLVLERDCATYASRVHERCREGAVAAEMRWRRGEVEPRSTVAESVKPWGAKA